MTHKKRAETMKRLSRLQSRLHQMAAIRLAEAEQSKLKLTGDRDALLQALSSDGMLGHLTIVAAAKRLHTLEARIAEANAECQSREQVVREEGRKAKLTETASSRADRQYREELDRRELAESIERWLLGRSSLGKAP